MAAEVIRMSSETSPLPPARDIPRRLWGAGEKESAASEERLLRMLPFYQSPTWARQNTDLPVIGASARVLLSAPKQFLNVFSITPTAPPPAPRAHPVVLLHGYGAGLGFYFRNYPALARWVAAAGAPLHALDWLGMGRSARVPFAVTAKRADVPSRVAQAEAFFVDSLEEWRAAQNVDKMTLVGHSLGAYLGAAYALRFPERVAKLAAQPSRELTDDQESVTSSSAGVGPATKQRVKEAHDEQKEKREKESMTRRLLTYLWEEGCSPFQIVRAVDAVINSQYASRRFSGLTEEETRNINDYILNITLAKGSGEYCICPPSLKVFSLDGQHDWMDPEGGAQSVERLRAAGNKDAQIYIIKNAGHHGECRFFFLASSLYICSLLNRCVLQYT
ncbi:alpha/beta-hydrolase [Phellopilus nigrolimitatus]|nr:alpha/beta-hydrolase [Phellopilus nigrolimitatus]